MIATEALLVPASVLPPAHALDPKERLKGKGGRKESAI